MLAKAFSTWYKYAGLVPAFLLPSVFFSCGPSASAPNDLTQMNIEDLMKVEVTSAAKKQQKLSEGPAAMLVITREDIARSGSTNIPELLRKSTGSASGAVECQLLGHNRAWF